MPDTTPFKEAAARKLCEQITDGHLPGYCARCSKITEALEAYAAERVAETHANVRGAVAAHVAERDAAIARAEAAEAEVARWKVQFESTNAAGIGVVEKLAVTEERVRVLETAARAALDEAWGFAGYTCSEFCVHSEDPKESCPMNSQALKALEAALAKAAGGQEGHDDQR